MAGARTETRDNIHHHPFSDLIMSAPLPEAFKFPVIRKYDGVSNDAEEHLAAFNAHMLIYGDTATDAIKCRTFPSTLTKFALRWFSVLPPKAINSFSELSAKFLERHALTIAVHKNDCSLRAFQQGPDESLREYINRFNQLAMQIDVLYPGAAIHAFREGLIPGRFTDSLALQRPQNLDELRRRASIFIEWEEEEEEEEPEPENMVTSTTRPYRGRNPNWWMGLSIISL